MEKSRITITIDKDLLSMVDKLIDKKSIRSRSHAIEMMIKKYFNELTVSTAVIHCGGKKPSFNKIIFGKEVIRHTVDFLKGEGVKNIFITVNERDTRIVKKLVGNKGIEIVKEKVPLGTGGALRRLKDKISESFLIINGDVFFELDLRDLVKFHRRSGAIATLCLTSVKEPKKYGVVEMKGSKIIKFVEKPRMARSYLINAGICLSEPEIFDFIPKKGFSMLEREVLPKIAEAKKLFGYVLPGKWIDVGRLTASQS